MKLLKNSLTREQLNLLQQTLQNCYTEKPPKGWFTSAEYAREIRRSQKTAQRSLSTLRLEHPELLLEKTFLIRAGTRTYPIKHYYVKSKKTKQSRTKR